MHVLSVNQLVRHQPPKLIIIRIRMGKLYGAHCSFKAESPCFWFGLGSATSTSSSGSGFSNLVSVFGMYKEVHVQRMSFFQQYKIVLLFVYPLSRSPFPMIGQVSSFYGSNNLDLQFLASHWNQAPTKKITRQVRNTLLVSLMFFFFLSKVVCTTKSIHHCSVSVNNRNLDVHVPPWLLSFRWCSGGFEVGSFFSVVK